MQNQNEGQRNLLLAVVICMAIFFIYDFLVLQPAQREARAAREAAQQQQAEAQSTQATDGGSAAQPARPMTAEEAVQGSSGQRITIDSRRLKDGEDYGLYGSINVTGARFDDLKLQGYLQTLPEAGAEPGDDGYPDKVRLLTPETAQNFYYAYQGWIQESAEGSSYVVGKGTPWQVTGNTTLTPENPVTLVHTAGALRIERTIAMDDNYMFTVTDAVTNAGSGEVRLSPVAHVIRQGQPGRTRESMMAHAGPIAVLNDRRLKVKYRNLEKKGARAAEQDVSLGGWVGITDKYWAVVAVPDQATQVRGELKPGRGCGVSCFEATYRADPLLIPAGDTVIYAQNLFAGAKRTELLEAYERDLNIKKLDLLMDWGLLWFFTRPFFWLLSLFQGWVGNFGIAILLLTVVVKLAFFPLANASYKAMARMKKLTEPMKEIRERFKEDKQRQQREILELYKREKVNPAAGCLPILVQIPVFFALYQVLSVTIEMRHAPFFGWIRDLSAKDPTNVWNLFGLLPYDPSGWFLLGGFLALGAWPLIMGLSMGFLQTLSPPPPDPMQARIFAFMPVIFTFIMAPFAAGLVIYWTWNNVLTIAQQYVITRRQGVDTPIGSWIARKLGRKPPKAKAKA